MISDKLLLTQPSCWLSPSAFPDPLSTLPCPVLCSGKGHFCITSPWPLANGDIRVLEGRRKENVFVVILSLLPELLFPKPPNFWQAVLFHICSLSCSYNSLRDPGMVTPSSFQVSKGRTWKRDLPLTKPRVLNQPLSFPLSFAHTFVTTPSWVCHHTITLWSESSQTMWLRTRSINLLLLLRFQTLTRTFLLIA